VENFFDADGLAGKDLAEVDFYLWPRQVLPQRVTTDGFVVERIVDVGQALMHTGGGADKPRGAVHVQGFMRALVVEDFDEVVEEHLLQEVASRGLGSFFKVRCMPSWQAFCWGWPCVRRRSYRMASVLK
jgi:hypothetical protein